MLPPYQPIFCACYVFVLGSGIGVVLKAGAVILCLCCYKLSHQMAAIKKALYKM